MPSPHRSTGDSADRRPPDRNTYRPPSGGAAEPVGPGDRPIGMALTMTVRRVVPVALLAVSLAVLGAGCGERSGSGWSDGAPGSSPGPASASRTAEPGGGAEADRVVFFSAAPKGPTDGHQVLHDRAEVERYAAAFGAQDPQARTRIVAAGRTTDFGRQVLVGWTATTGCSAATAAALSVSGNRLELRVSQPEPPPECLVAFRVSVVFQVARERIPAQPVFG
ncbi:hypothetical protein OG900_27190 [Streptomyces sp. NBC_00433]